ncbi:unnamed protein product [Heligmosomoides polygyrus]|uniref:CCHC-type domain-containing protein n=1 Tax=Heligmosomoides polygyrus TaxID=6339 RepID=A0A183FQ79_HELPZ|nr:unnamed protein product [Heligmosomoides polygyrus]
MADKKSQEERENLKKKRREEERILIDILKCKRSCVRLAPTRLLKKAYRRDPDEFAEIRGSQPKLYARGEAAFYRARVENAWLKTNHVKERFCHASEGIAMTYETYNFFILAEGASHESRANFFAGDVQGLSLDPAFTSDYIRKEIDYFDEILSKMQTEIRNATIQMTNKVHTAPLTELKNTLAGFIESTQQRLDHLHEEIKKQGEKLAELASVLKTVSDEESNLIQTFEGVRQTTPQLGKVTVDEIQEGAGSTVHDGDVEEHRDETPKAYSVNNSSWPSEIYGEWRLHELLSQTETLESVLRVSRRVPKRCITFQNRMRPEESFLRCAFCDMKGEHYSDSCPIYKDVDSRKRRIQCTNCLDDLHTKERFRRPRWSCMYCGSEKHNKAICTLPEDVERSEWKLRALQDELADLEDRICGPSTSRFLDHFVTDVVPGSQMSKLAIPLLGVDYVGASLLSICAHELQRCPAADHVSAVFSPLGRAAGWTPVRLDTLDCPYDMMGI